MQAWPLEQKIRVTQTRIFEWYIRWNGKVYISFSGGKDSTVLLDLTRRVYPDIEAIFVDTGLEYPEIREFVKTKENITWLKPEMNFKKVIEKYGYPIISKRVSRNVSDVQRLGNNCWAIRCFNGEKTGFYDMRRWKFLIDAPFKVSNKCCDIMKKKPLKQFGKNGKKPIIATMACESQQRRVDWMKKGCNSFDGEQISKPMSFWTEQDVLRYIKQSQIPYASVYGKIIEVNKGSKKNHRLLLETTGEPRTGCMFCMFGVHLEKEPNKFQRMAITHPKQYNYCMHNLGLKEVLDYIGVKY